MKNIMHLEDAAFFLSPEEIAELVTALIMNIGAKQNVGHLNIKWDGTCLVFGNQDGFFISDKGFYNKTPRRFRSEDDIHLADMQVEKKIKLLNAFSTLVGTYVRPEMVYTADWLFDHLTLEDGKTFQPNLITYTSKHNLRPFKLGLAVHTQAYCGIEGPSTWSPATHRTVVYCAATQQERSPEIEGYQRLYKLVMGLASNTKPLTKDEIKDFRKTLNDIVRKHDYYERAQLDVFTRKGYDFLAFNIDILIRLKYTLLMQLNTIAEEYNTFQMSIGGEPTTHEGFVFRFKDHKVKLVDRYRFSKKNFDPTISRGWATNGLRITSLPER